MIIPSYCSVLLVVMFTYLLLAKELFDLKPIEQPLYFKSSVAFLIVVITSSAMAASKYIRQEIYLFNSDTINTMIFGFVLMLYIGCDTAYVLDGIYKKEMKEEDWLYGAVKMWIDVVCLFLFLLSSC